MIEIIDLHKFYGETHAVKGLTLSINKGEILGLLGPNGAGKSTSLKILTQSISASKGEIKFDGKNPKDDPLLIKKMIGYLPESTPLYKEMLVFDYLLFAAQMHNMSKKEGIKRIKSLANLCAISSVMDKPIHTLSKGYKQRVGLAYALISDPPILILDEPTSGLDPNQRAEIREMIKNLGKDKTIILSTHILSEAEATCDRIVIMNKGQIVADDTPKALEKRSSQGQHLVLSLEGGSYKDYQSAFLSIEGVISIQNYDSTELLIKADKDIRREIFSKIKNKNWVILEMRQKLDSLEYIFQKLTEGKQ